VWPPPPSRPFLNLRCSLMHLLLRCPVRAPSDWSVSLSAHFVAPEGSAGQTGKLGIHHGADERLAARGKRGPLADVISVNGPRSWPRQLGAGNCPFPAGRGGVGRALARTGSARPEGPPADGHRFTLPPLTRGPRIVKSLPSSTSVQWAPRLGDPRQGLGGTEAVAMTASGWPDRSNVECGSDIDGWPGDPGLPARAREDHCHLPAASSPAAPVSRVSPGRRCRLSRCRTVMRWGEGWCSSMRPPWWR
jgi:hypothetical protein